jgi:hypothetical protein
MPEFHPHLRKFLLASGFCVFPALLFACSAAVDPDEPLAVAVHLGPDPSAVVAQAVGRVAVRVHRGGRPVSGVAVTFTVTAGGGSINGDQVITDGDGIATAGAWILGTVAGTNVLTAKVEDAIVIFRVIGVAGSAERIEKVEGDNQQGRVQARLPVPPAVRVVDRFGNSVLEPLVFAYAVASGGGSVGGDGYLDSDRWTGVATVPWWALGPLVGLQSLVVVLEKPGLSSNRVTFTAQALPN